MKKFTGVVTAALFCCSFLNAAVESSNIEDVEAEMFSCGGLCSDRTLFLGANTNMSSSQLNAYFAACVDSCNNG